MEKLIPDLDYYYDEAGLMVLTEHYLKQRGYCCENGCRHCPYGFKTQEKLKDSSQETPLLKRSQ